MDKYKETELKIIHFSIKYKDKLHRLIEYGVDRSWFREANIAAMWAIICEFYIDKEKSRLTAHNFIEYLKSKNVDSIKLAKYKEFYDEISCADLTEDDFPYVLEKFTNNVYGYKIIKEFRNTEALLKEGKCVEAHQKILDGLFNITHNQSGRGIEIGDFFEDKEAQLKDILDRYENPGDFTGIMTGLENLDEDFGGFEKGSLTIVAALVSTGKTSLLRELSVVSHYRFKRNVLAISLEETKSQWERKMNSRLCNIDHDKIRRGKLTEAELKTLINKIKEREKNPHRYKLLCLPAKMHTAAEITDMITKCFNFFTPDIVFVDYISLIKTDGKADRYDIALGDVAKHLKSFAKIANIPVVVAAQVNRAAIKIKRGQRVVDIGMENIEDSNKVGQDADNIIAIQQDNTRDDIIWIKVIKQREGRKDYSVPVKFNKRCYHFSPYNDADQLSDMGNDTTDDLVKNIEDYDANDDLGLNDIDNDTTIDTVTTGDIDFDYSGDKLPNLEGDDDGIDDLTSIL